MGMVPLSNGDWAGGRAHAGPVARETERHRTGNHAHTLT